MPGSPPSNRHFGADVLERFHLEVRRSHPGLYRTEGMLYSLTALSHLNPSSRIGGF
jgi:hypothetical protein